MPGSDSAHFDVDHSSDYVRQLEQLLDSSPVPAYIKDRENRFTFANATICERLGLSRSEVLGKTSHELWPREIADGLRANDERVLTSGQAVVAEETILEADGLRVFLTNKYPILDDAGSVVAVGGMSADITDFKRAQSEALAVRAQLATALESMTDAVSITDAAGRLTDFNPAFVSFHRFASREECVDTLEQFSTIFDIFTVDGDPAPQDQWPVPRALRGETGTDVEYGVRRKDTGETWVATYGYAPLRNAAGKITGTISVGRDVTEQRRGEQRLAQVERLIEAQAALAKSEDQFALVVENITDVIWTMDLDTMRLTYMTPSVERLLGYTPHEALDVELEELLPPDSLERVRATLSSGIEGIAHGDTLGLRVTEVDQYRKDGSTVATEVTTRFLPTPDGRPHLVLGITRDIAERKLAEEGLRESEERLRQLVESAHDFIWEVDEGWVYKFVSAQVTSILGYEPSELVGTTPFDLMPPEEAARVGHEFAEIINDRRPFVNLRNACRHKDGPLVVLETNGIPFFGAAGDLRGYRGTDRDITERIKAETALREDAERHQAILQTAMDGFGLIDMEGHLLEVNEAYTEMCGYSAQELLTMRMQDLVSSGRADEIADHMKTVLIDGRDRFESEHVRKDGSVFAMELSVQYRPVAGGQMAAFIRDITQIKTAEERVLRSNTRLAEVLRSVVQTMGKVVEARDPYTQGHEKGVATIAMLIAGELGLSEDEVDGVEVAALVHDVGKLTVPAEILTKPGRLSNTEFSLIKEHSQAGYDILKDIDFDWPVADIVLQHHERMDGSGYPKGLLGDEISMAGRILMVADVIQAMAAHRPYRPALGLDAAIAEITSHPEQFDPQVIAACVRLFEAGLIEV